MPSWAPEDVVWMRRVLELAAQAYGETSPNPLVGALVVGPRGVLGTGVHRRAGLPHAEPQAIDAALAEIQRAQDASADLTLFVNLEPCSHHGQTPPCVDAILCSPVRRVVAAMVDPNPQVAGSGIARLRASGVQVDVGCLGREAAELNHVFVARHLRRRPFVALKVALSADGCIAGAGGEPARITGDTARAHTHWLRAGLDAILVGVETLRRDRPRLDRRLYHGPGRNPRRLVLDPNLRCRPEWLWACAPPGHGRARAAATPWHVPEDPRAAAESAHPPVERALVFCADDTLARGAAVAPELAARAAIVPLPRAGPSLDLGALVTALEVHGLSSVLVEGGGHTQRTFFEADLWDRVYVYENPALHLAGLAWQAAPLWALLRSGAYLQRSETLGGDRLDVFDHPHSVFAGG